MSIAIGQVASFVVAELEKTVCKNESIVDFFKKNIQSLEDVVLFGGAIRDIFLFGVLKETSDLDFVVRCDRRMLAEVLSVFNPTENKFGGFRFYFGNRGIDIWALEDTWAIKRGHVANRDNAVMLDLLGTTFFNIDSVYFRVKEGNLVCSKKFFDGIKSKKLTINLYENPFPLGIVKRIKKMHEEKGMEIDDQLRKYISNSNKYR